MYIIIIPDTSGITTLSNSVFINSKTIYNNIFNSSGFGHGTITDLKNITDFGYRFINSPATNGPGNSTNGQYYTWM